MIKWDDESLSIGIALIDNQHKMLVHLLNQLAKAIEEPLSNENERNLAIKTIYNQLTDYSQYHFDTEEAYFLQLNNDDIACHIKQHRNFIEQLTLFTQQGQLTNQAKSVKLLNFLTDWLIYHIQHEDKKFVKRNL
jgi:hemerythrin